MPRSLTFSVADDFVIAAQNNTFDTNKVKDRYCCDEIGPFVELFLHFNIFEKSITRIVALNAFSELHKALTGQFDRWLCPASKNLGYIRPKLYNFDMVSPPRVHFLYEAERAAIRAGIPRTTAKKLIGAIGELENNILDHSKAEDTGLIAFQVTKQHFEFVIVDQGIGILASLASSSKFSKLSDHGVALREALQDGVSRFGVESGHGYGFRQLFVGLANLYGELRFHSGDHALVIDGTNPTLPMAKIVQKPPFNGLFIAVRCRLSQSQFNC